MGMRSSTARWMRAPEALGVLVLLVAACGPVGTPELRVSSARAAVPISGSSQIVLAIHNDGDGGDQLVDATTDAALGVEVHLTEIADGLATMRQLDAVDLPAGSSTRFRPGDLHLMLVVPDPEVVEGATFDLTLHFERSDARTVQVTVVDLLDLAEGSLDD